ncbi:MAG: type II toxin-antitoxin system VapC family toxin [Saprospiraceae bacterium]|nr:type II toxin-antitoxin system VapC family toxin [Saprospiraceae bacterium]
MNLLLDTHALIWLGENDQQLSVTAKTAIETATNTKFVSVASFWEIAIKARLGKLVLLKPLDQIIKEIEESDAIILGVSPRHTLLIEQMPLHHRDPFDRMLIAQASIEGLTIVTLDPHFSDYGVPILW